MPAHGVDKISGSYLMICTNALDNIRDDVQLHNLAVDDRIARQIFKTEADQIKAVQLAVKLDHFYRTRTDIKTGHTFLFTEHYFSSSLLALFEVLSLSKSFLVFPPKVCESCLRGSFATY